MGIDVEFTGNPAVLQYWHHDLAFDTGTAGKIVRLLGDVLDHESLLACGRLAADPLAEPDARMLGGLSDIGSQD